MKSYPPGSKPGSATYHVNAGTLHYFSGPQFPHQLRQEAYNIVYSTADLSCQSVGEDLISFKINTL